MALRERPEASSGILQDKKGCFGNDAPFFFAYSRPPRIVKNATPPLIAKPIRVATNSLVFEICPNMSTIDIAPSGIQSKAEENSPGP